MLIWELTRGIQDRRNTFRRSLWAKTVSLILFPIKLITTMSPRMPLSRVFQASENMTTRCNWIRSGDTAILNTPVRRLLSWAKTKSSSHHWFHTCRIQALEHTSTAEAATRRISRSPSTTPSKRELSVLSKDLHGQPDSKHQVPANTSHPVILVISRSQITEKIRMQLLIN